MVTKMADKIGLNREIAIFGPNLRPLETDIFKN